MEARIRFASGEVDRAAKELRTALDTVAPQDFRPYEGTPTVVSDIAAAANVFAYQGDLASAAKTIDLADQVRREVILHPGRGARGTSSEALAPDGAGRAVRGDRRPDGVAAPGVAERRRGGADGARPTSGSTWRTAAPRRRSASSPGRRPTAARSASTAR